MVPEGIPHPHGWRDCNRRERGRALIVPGMLLALRWNLPEPPESTLQVAVIGEEAPAFANDVPRTERGRQAESFDVRSARHLNLRFRDEAAIACRRGRAERCDLENVGVDVVE